MLTTWHLYASSTIDTLPSKDDKPCHNKQEFYAKIMKYLTIQSHMHRHLAVHIHHYCKVDHRLPPDRGIEGQGCRVSLAIRNNRKLCPLNRSGNGFVPEDRSVLFQFLINIKIFNNNIQTFRISGLQGKSSMSSGVSFQANEPATARARISGHEVIILFRAVLATTSFDRK